MTSGAHGPWTDRLSEYLDGGLEPAERAAVEDHLAECSGCRVVLEELRDVVERARGLGDLPPSRDLWPAIARNLAAPRRGLFLTRRELAAAAVVLVAVSSAVTGWAVSGTSAPGGSVRLPGPGTVSAVASVGAPPEALAVELDALEQTLAEARDRMEPSTVRIVERNLRVVEEAIAESILALAEDPENAFLREHLERAWRRKAEYMREAARIAEWTG